MRRQQNAAPLARVNKASTRSGLACGSLLIWCPVVMLALAAPQRGLSAEPQTSASENDPTTAAVRLSQQLLVAESYAEVNALVEQAQALLRQPDLTTTTKARVEAVLTAAQVRRAQWVYDVIVQRLREPNFVNGPLVALRVNALTDLEDVLQRSPDTFDAHWLVGRLHSLPGGERTRSLEAFADALRLAGNRPALRAKVLLARASLQGKSEAAAVDFQEAIRLQPKNPAAWRARGLWLLQQGLKGRALDDLQKAVELAPRHRATAQLFLQVLLADQPPEDAKQLLDEAIAEMPQVTEFYRQRAERFLQAGAFAEAIVDLTTLLELQPNNPDVLIARADVLLRLEKTSAALRDLDRALTYRPADTRALRLQSLMWNQQGETIRAIAMLEDALRGLAAGDAALGIWLGALYLQENRLTEALQTFDNIVKAEPTALEARRARADLLLRLGRSEAAAADYRAVLESAPNDVASLNNLAWLLATSPDEKLRDGKRALELALKACELTNNDQPGLLSTLAAAQAELGDFAAASQTIAQAIELADEAPVQKQLAAEQAEYQAGRPWRQTATTARVAEPPNSLPPAEQLPASPLQPQLQTPPPAEPQPEGDDPLRIRLTP